MSAVPPTRFRVPPRPRRWNNEDKGQRLAEHPGIASMAPGRGTAAKKRCMMAQDKSRKRAIRARMARTGESYLQATRRIGGQPELDLPPLDTMLAIAGKAFDVSANALTLAARHCAETEAYPVLGKTAAERLKVYLDTKDWVALANARLGRPQYPHDQVAYELLREATARGEVIVPLTLTTHMEISRIASLRQRTDLADVIAEISGFVTIAGRSVLVEHQLRTALSARYGVAAPAPIDVFGLGVAFASGNLRRLVLKDRGGAAPSLPVEAVHKFETVARVVGEYIMVRGPKPEELPELRALGYRPEEVEKVEQQRLKRERDLAARLENGDARRDRLGDIVHARHLYWELDQHLYAGLAHYGLDVDEFFGHGKQWLTEFLDDIPSAAVVMTLNEKAFRDSYKQWTGNDLRDTDAMSSAIPYCDVAMTDKHVAAQLKRSPAVTRQGTLLLSRLRDLNDALPGLIAHRNDKPA